MSKYRDELDIEYEEFRDNSSYKIVSIIVANWTNTFIRVEFSISINPYKSKSMKDFPLQFYGLFDRTTAEFKRFGFAHPTVIVNK